MRNVSRFLVLVLFEFVVFPAGGVAQGAKTTGEPGDIHRYELLVQQPTEANNGAAWWKLAMLYQDAARYAESEHAYRRAIELLRTSDALTQANLMDNLGTMYVETARYTDAEQLEQKALAIRKDRKDSLGIGLSWMHLAMLSLGRQQNADGEMYAELAVSRLVPDRRIGTENDFATPEQKMTALIYLSLARCATHDCAEALPPLKKAMTIAEANYPSQGLPLAYIGFLEGYAEWKRGDIRSAARLMKSGTAAMEAQLGWGHPTYISAMRQYEHFLVATRQNAEAAEIREKLARSSVPQPTAQSARSEGILALP